MLRCSNTGDWMVMLAIHYEDTEKINMLFSHLESQFPQITSLCYVVNGKLQYTWTDLPVITWKGKGYLEEKMEDLVFKNAGPNHSFKPTAGRP